MKMQNVLLFAVLLLAPLAFAAEAEIEVEEFEAEMAHNVLTALGNAAHYKLWLPKNVSAHSFDLRFEVKGNNDIHFAFMCEKQERTADSWEVVLGGWGNSQSVIRKGTQGQILTRASGRFCDANAFKPFMISLEDGELSVYAGHQESSPLIMSAQVPALGCRRMNVGLGGWNVPVEFRKLDEDDIVPTVPTIAPPAKCNWILLDGYDMRAPPVCKPGYTNMHPENPDLEGHCKAQPDVAARWCDADPNCDGVQCTAWNTPEEGCEPVSTKSSSGFQDPVFGHKSAYVCERTPKRDGVEYWPHFG